MTSAGRSSPNFAVRHVCSRSAKFRKSPLVEFPAIAHPSQLVQRAVQEAGLGRHGAEPCRWESSECFRPGAAPPRGLAHHALPPPPAEWPEPPPRHPAANARSDERARSPSCALAACSPVGSDAQPRRRRSDVLRRRHRPKTPRNNPAASPDGSVPPSIQYPGGKALRPPMMIRSFRRPVTNNSPSFRNPKSPVRRNGPSPVSAR